VRNKRLFETPILLLSPPRSGSSFLQTLMHSSFKGLWGYEREYDHIWWKYFPYRRSKLSTDFIAAKEMTPYLSGEIRSTYATMAYARSDQWNVSRVAISRKNAPLRLLDKTIAHAFHLNVLESVFPGFVAIYLIRDPRPNLASMIEAWKSDKFMKRKLIKKGWKRVIGMEQVISIGGKEGEKRLVEAYREVDDFEV